MIIKRPIITEKSAALAGRPVPAYVFEVDPSATKREVGEAIKKLYQVTPTKISVVRLPARQVFSRGKIGRRRAVKKAIVYLPAGQKIEF